MKLENNLGTDPIRPLVLRIAIPSMLAQFVSVLYSIVDRIYISNIPVIGETALSGIGDLSVTLYDSQDAERAFSVYSGTGKIWLNGRIVRLDYFGNGRAEALSRELANLLRGESGVAN